MSDRIRVLVAEADPQARTKVSGLLSGQPNDFELVGAVADANAAIDLARSAQPHVALVDVAMPGGGPAAAAGILAVSPSSHVIAFSLADDHGSVAAMLRAGACGYLIRGVTAEGLFAGIRAGAAGRPPLSDALSAEFVAGFGDEAGRQRRKDDVAFTRALELELLATKGTIAAVFQPIVDVVSRETVGFEGLARFPDGESPETVFSDAARCGKSLILEIAAARAQLAAFRRALGDGAGRYLAINASPRVLDRTEFFDLVRPARGERRVVEITEREDEDPELLRRVVHRSRDAGMLVAIDDTGAGFAGLQRVVTVVPDIVKLDRSLITNIDSERPKRALVAAFARYCDEMACSLVVEGVETEGELAVLREVGVRLAQGYLLARPEAFS